MTANTFDVLRALVERATCKPGWVFDLRESEETGALELVISVPCQDSNDARRSTRIAHHRPVPVTTYNEATWRRWLFEKCRDVETHEIGEWFKVDGKRPFPPLHGPGEDPYTVHEFREWADAETIQDGRRVPYDQR